MTEKHEEDQIETFIIDSEEKAWRLLEKLVNDEPMPENFLIKFDNWPKHHLKFSGRDWHGSVPTRIMSPLLELQRDIYRAYTTVCYNTTNLRRLSNEDRDILELVVKVEEGSSDFKTNLHEQLNVMALKAIDKMDSKHIAITVIGVALTFTSGSVARDWISTRQQEKQIEQTIELSKQETERLKVFANAEKKAPDLTEIKEDAIASQNRILKAAKPGDEVTVSNITLDSTEVADVVQEERARSKDIDIQGMFRVLSNDTTSTAGFKIKVSRINDGATFNAIVPIELDSDQQNLIRDAEWSKGAKLVNLSMTASLLRGKVSDAVIYSATEVED